MSKKRTRHRKYTLLNTHHGYTISGRFDILLCVAALSQETLAKCGSSPNANSDNFDLGYADGYQLGVTGLAGFGASRAEEHISPIAYLQNVRYVDSEILIKFASRISSHDGLLTVSDWNDDGGQLKKIAHHQSTKRCCQYGFVLNVVNVV